jgi:hypothetical protein
VEQTPSTPQGHACHRNGHSLFVRETPLPTPIRLCGKILSSPKSQITAPIKENRVNKLRESAIIRDREEKVPANQPGLFSFQKNNSFRKNTLPIKYLE